MTKKTENVLRAGMVLALIGGMEYYFFHAPDLRPRPAFAAQESSAASSLVRPGEKHLRNIRQLTFGGQNAEAYWSFDGKKISWQGNPGDLKADQIFVMNADGSGKHMVSTGKGKCTCSYFTKDGKWVYFASTHLGGDEPPPEPDRSRGYVWPVSDTYDIFRVHPDGSGIERITDTPGYDAEDTISPDGKTIVFTSMRDGDLDLYTMDLNGKHVKRLTDELGYDGGAFFSPDGKMICYRSHHPQTPEDVKEYKDLLASQLVKPLHMELMVMDADGSHKRQITHNGAANFCPFFTPDGKRLIFSSNMDDPKGRNFEIYLVNLDGTGLERVTNEPTFDGFPMFSPDGKKLVWASNRNGKQPHETNVFVADWAW
jgi:Tol biopolymer transport system component